MRFMWIALAFAIELLTGIPLIPDAAGRTPRAWVSHWLLLIAIACFLLLFVAVVILIVTLISLEYI
jgi:hypothetical protein